MLEIENNNNGTLIKSKIGDAVINSNIFNVQKSDYEVPSLFLGQSFGLVDSVNKHYPELFALYKKLKNQDWDENEFNFSSCLTEFKTVDPHIAKKMITTLAWQWEADTVAARSIFAITAPFVSSDVLGLGLQRIGDNECLTGDHEVLTPKGWKRIDEVTIEDKVAQWDSETHSVSFVQPERIIDKNYDGQLYHFHDVVNNVSQLTTPEHRMPIVYPYWTNSNQPEFKIAEDVFYHGGNGLPTSGFIKSGSRKLSPQEKLYIAVQADGSLCGEKYTGANTGYLHYRFGFSKRRKIERLLYLCGLAGWNVTEIDSKDDKGVKHFIVYVPINEYNDKAKTFDWFDLDQIGYEWALDFIEELKYWDGNITDSGRIRYISSNKKCVDKVVALAHLVGCRGHITTIHPRYNVTMPNGCLSNTKEAYQVYITDRDYVTGNSIIKSVIDYSGKVYCLTVPTGYFIIRHNNAVTITGNCLHALTYSEIVRNSFEDSETVISTILKDQEALKRMSVVTDIFNEAYITGHKLALGMVEKNQDTYNVIFMFFVAMYCLERIQFNNSFTVTFAIAHDGDFVPIGEAVKKICNDELEIHAKFARTVLAIELKTQRGRTAFNMLKDKIQLLLDTVLDTELRWVNEHLFADNTPLNKLSKEQLIDNCLYNASPVYQFFGMKYKLDFPTTNNLPWLDGWTKIDKAQESAQELRGGRYFLGGFINDHHEKDYSHIVL